MQLAAFHPGKTSKGVSTMGTNSEIEVSHSKDVIKKLQLQLFNK